jgi:SNF2 family DNA or RNA helicase
MLELIARELEKLKALPKQDRTPYLRGEYLYREGNCQILTHAKNGWEVLVTDPEEETATEVKIGIGEEQVFQVVKGKPASWDGNGVAALMQVAEDLQNSTPKIKTEGKVYTREGMVKRVLDERREKADKSKYKITFADNIYGEHTLVNERGVRYLVTLRDFESETGYINNPDLRTNKLGTTKHLMYAFKALKSKPRTFEKLSKRYPFVEVYLDPQRDYCISWYYPHTMTPGAEKLIKRHFGNDRVLPEEDVKDFLLFIRDAGRYPSIKIRPEVEEKVRRAWEQEMLRTVEKDEKLDFSLLKTELFPYQREGVQFATFREGAILADEMGLGKTIQAIATAVMKKKLFGFKKCLIICPASLKEQWAREIERFSHESAEIVQGMPARRRDTYRNNDAYFIIANYETVLRDVGEMNRMQPEFIVLDEAQRIKNFSTVTAQNIKRLQKKHALVITGTPIENRLTDLYSVMGFVDPGYLAPLWEFSYQHCYFDESKKDKITGYYNLQQLKERLSPVLLRREKSKVLRDLPQVTQINVPVNMHPDQREYHTSFAKGVASILAKKFITPYDMQKLMLLLANMRMVCDCTYLIDKESYKSPKLDELEHVLVEKFDLKNAERKIIIFSEWTHMLNIIGKMLHKNGIGYAQLSGKVAVKHRGQLVRKFETDSECKVFLSTEAGGSGLNLQVADTVINFELPWNPAKKNQRIGRIDRLGQRAKQLTVLNFITRDSIEVKIASGLTLKQNLFDGVLSTDEGPDVVDFSASGKAQFLQELEALMGELTSAALEDDAVETALTSQEAASLEELISEDEGDAEAAPESLAVAEAGPSAPVPQADAMEKVLNNGMEFLSGLLQMATGKAVGLENKRVEVDAATGEVVMRFKLPTL